MTLLYCTTDQVWVSSISVKFCGSYAPFVTYNTGNTQFSALFSRLTCFDIFSWNFAHDFCYTVLQIKFEFCQFASIFVGVMPLLELRILKIHSFLHFSLTCFDILSWNFATWLCFTKIQTKFKCRHFASIFVGVMPLLEHKILKTHSFPHFSLTCFDILSWSDFVLLKYRPSSSVVNLRQVLWELCPFWNLEYLKYSFSSLFSYMLEIQFFRTFLLHALTYWAEIFHMTLFNVLQIKFECRHFCVHPFYLKI